MGAKGGGKKGGGKDARPHAQMIEDARAGAASRTLAAYRKLTGLGAADPQQSAAEWTQARSLAQKLLGFTGIEMDRVKTVVTDMLNHLKPDSFSTVSAVPGDLLCEAWPAYSTLGGSVVTLCPAFFDASSDEQRIRLLIHESAHLAGIGSPAAEEYCTEYNCEDPCGDKDSADNWAQFAHCLSGATPDQTKEMKLRPKK